MSSIEGDGRTLYFSFRPLCRAKSEEFIKEVLSKSIVDDDEGPEPSQINNQLQIMRSTFAEIFYLSRGAPRYIKNYI